jgi:hypothetical protein
MRRLLLVLALIVAACDRQPVVLEPEEIDVCSVVADQLENLLVEIVEFVESASVAELASDTATELANRGAALSQRGIDLGCDPADIRAQISTDRLESDDPVAREYIDAVVEQLGR